VKKRMDELMARDPLIDTVILGCTHYPLLLPKIKKYASPNVRIVPQGEYVAHSLQDYLSRHPEMESRLTKEGTCHYLTTENPLKFQESAQIFLHEKVDVEHIAL
jgi:glutamate racemase